MAELDKIEAIFEKEEISETGDGELDRADGDDANLSVSSNRTINSDKARRHNLVPISEVLSIQ